MHKDVFGRTWDIPVAETCNECGQPDNCGDCNHYMLPPESVIQLGGMLSVHGG